MDNNEKKTKEQEENERAGKLAGIGAGVITGATIGSVVPIVGTFAGGLVGGVVGSEVGKKVGGKLLNTFKKDSSENRVAQTDVTAELEKLAKLREQGMIDDEEFKAAKAKLLNL